MAKLLQTIYNNSPDLLNEVKTFIARGEDLSVVTEYCESALSVSSNNGRFDVVWLLLENGADGKQLGWTPTFYEVAFGDLDSIRKSINTHRDLEARDNWSRTPWLLSLQVGDIDKAALLLESGADQSVAGRCGKTPMAYCIQHNDVAMLQRLIEQGFDIEAVDEFQTTPLMVAAEAGMAECVKLLIEAGADISKSNDIPERAIQMASTMEVVQLLVDAGEDINDINEDTHAAMLGTEVDGTPTVTRQQYLKGKYRQFGKTNPQLMDNPYWLSMIKCGANAWGARSTYDDENGLNDKPVWCYQRFGRTLNKLPGGRIIEIAGEHEDNYDPDFCIYNDITVFHPDGRIELYGYPQSVFPPTDNHSATLVGDTIYIIGNLGYHDKRHLGRTPVYKLDIHTYQIEKVDTTGPQPGWIYRHKARFDGSNTITLSTGEIMLSKDSYMENHRVYTLNLDTMEWGEKTEDSR